MKRSTILAAVLAASALATAGLAFLAMPRVSAGQPCTVSEFAAAHGIGLSAPREVPSVAAADLTAGSAQEPGSSVAEYVVAHMESSQIPSLNGRDGVLMRLVNVPPEPIVGPVGQQPMMAAVQCAVSIYDADTGAFLLGYRSLASP